VYMGELRNKCVRRREDGNATDFDWVVWVCITRTCKYSVNRDVYSSGILRSVVSCRRFGITYRCHFQVPWTASSLKMGPIDPDLTHSVNYLKMAASSRNMQRGCA
jgi:hypothetical protein